MPDYFRQKRSRTRDQMVQAARSGVQNIAEGSMASATSKRTEIKLTGVARASLEELLLEVLGGGRIQRAAVSRAPGAEISMTRFSRGTGTADRA